MNLITDKLEIETKGDAELVDITKRVAKVIERHHLAHGQVLLFVVGSTAGLTTIEYEPELRKDFPALFERLAPKGDHYHHEETWHDGNGHSHVRASLLGPSLTIPVGEGALLLGTWQQIVLVDFDNRPRDREIVVQMIGEIS